MINQCALRFGLSLFVTIFVTLSWTALVAANSPPASNFVIRVAGGRVDSGPILQQCETLRSQIFKTWHHSPATPWNPRCELVIHFSRSSYRDQVGPGSEQTTGSSLIRFGDQGVIHRRIDLLVDPSGSLTALPHELTHVVLADVFQGRKPPPWVDEGIATLADPEAKRNLHHRDCRQAIEAGAAIRVAELLSLERLSRADQVAAFYGQSLSLTRFLVEQSDPKAFIQFVHHAFDVGYDRAIREHYGFESIAEMEKAWRRFERSHPSTREGQPNSIATSAEPFVELIRLNDSRKLP